LSRAKASFRTMIPTGLLPVTRIGLLSGRLRTIMDTTFLAYGAFKGPGIFYTKRMPVMLLVNLLAPFKLVNGRIGKAVDGESKTGHYQRI
jgi:hypothetical protein